MRALVHPGAAGERNCTRALAGTALALAGTLLASCSTVEYTYKMYGGPPRPPQDLAVLSLGDVVGVMIDGRKIARSDYSRVELLPGRYPVYWECVYGVSVMIEPPNRWEMRCIPASHKLPNHVSTTHKPSMNVAIVLPRSMLIVSQDRVLPSWETWRRPPR